MMDVMIVDDDQVIRDYLKDIIEWETLSLRLVCEAADGIAAWEEYSLHRPRIVIADINIPLMSGLELAKQIVDETPDVRVIIITAYNDFENARAAMALGAIDLIPKPIEPVEINAALRKSITELSELQQYHQSEQALKDLLAENRPQLQERFAARLLSGPQECTEEACFSQAELLGLPFTPGNFAVIHFRLHINSDDLLFPAAFHKLCNAAFFAAGFCVFSYYSESSCLTCIAGWDIEKGENRIEAILSKLSDEADFYFKRSFTASIGGTVFALGQLYLSARQATLAERFQGEEDPSIVSYQDISRLTPVSQIYDPDLLHQALDSARALDLGKVGQILDDLGRNIEIDGYREFSIALISRLGSILLQAGLNPWSSVNYPDTIAQIFSVQTAKDMEHITYKACELLIGQLYQQRIHSKNQLIRQAENFIHRNLSDPELSLDLVSNSVGLSKIYFCQLFSRETGVSFSTYLNIERVALAKSLLHDGKKRISEVSEEVGYNSPKYFSHIFKTIAGKTPGEYRRGLYQ